MDHNKNSEIIDKNNKIKEYDEIIDYLKSKTLDVDGNFNQNMTMDDLINDEYNRKILDKLNIYSEKYNDRKKQTEKDVFECFDYIAKQ